MELSFVNEECLIIVNKKNENYSQCINMSNESKNKLLNNSTGDGNKGLIPEREPAKRLPSTDGSRRVNYCNL